MEISVIIKSIFFILFVGLFPIVYALAIVVSAFYLNLGWFSLPYVFAMTAPVIAFWAIIKLKEAKARYVELMKPQQEWNVDKFVKEYQELLKKQENENDEKN